VYQVGNNKKVILWCKANQISRINYRFIYLSFKYSSTCFGHHLAHN